LISTGPIATPSFRSLLLQPCFNDIGLGWATGVVVPAKGGYALMTARHVVTGRHHDTGGVLHKQAAIPNKLTIFHHRREQLLQWIEMSEPLLRDDTPLWKEHPEFGARVDFVALPLTQLADAHLHAYDPSRGTAEFEDGTLYDTLSVGPADPVSVIGFPFGMTAGGKLPIWATGTLATEPIVSFQDLPLSLVDCRTRQGQSGSPVIAHRNRGVVPTTDGGATDFGYPVWQFLGIYSGRINAESDLGMVWKAQALAQLIDSM
jgi:Trypsin-like peptidase domain